MLTYPEETVVNVRPFTTERAGEEVIIGSADAGVFLSVPPEAVELLQQLATGKSVGEVSDLYEQKYGETPDLDDFLAVLHGKGIIHLHGAVEDNHPAAPVVSSARRYHFSNFPQRMAERIFSAPAIACCAVLIALAFGLVIKHPKLAPVAADVFFTDRRALTWGIIVVFDLITVFLHEFAHLVAARAQGVKSRMGLSNRLWDLVAETDLSGLWSVPKRKRYLPMLAGMLLDAACGSLIILLLFAEQSRWLAVPPFGLRLLRAFAFGYVMRLLWEFSLFIRTDVYYVLATSFDCKNLMADTRAFLRNQLRRFVPSLAPIDQSGIPAREMRMIRGYAFIWIGGRFWAILMLLWVTIPLTIKYVRDLTHLFQIGYSADPANFTDGLIITTVFLTFTIAGFALWIRNLLIRKAT